MGPPDPNNDAPGPPQKGDSLLLVKNESGKLKLFTVSERQSLDIGTISGGQIFEPPDELDLNSAGISGTFKDVNDNPIKGITFYATDNTLNPDESIFFNSQPSDSKGIFKMGFPGKGTFRLKLWSETRQEPVTNFSLPEDEPKVKKDNPLIKIEGKYLIVTIKENRPMKGITIKVTK